MISISFADETDAMSTLDGALPLGKGVRSIKNGHVLQLYCLAKDATNPTACIKAQYAIFSDDELLPKDALGNVLVKKRSLTPVGPVLTIESAADIKQRLTRTVSDKNSNYLTLPKVRYPLTRWYYHALGPWCLVPSALGGGWVYWVATYGSATLSAVAAGTGILFFTWPLITDTAVNIGKQSLAIAVDAVKILIFPFKKIFARSHVSAETITESFTNQDGFNWADTPIDIDKGTFESLVTSLNGQ